MCDSRQPLNGADSELRCYWCNQTGATYLRDSGRWYHYACWTDPQPRQESESGHRPDHIGQWFV